MIKIYNIDEPVTFNNHPIVACIGYFDGVHLGHQALINETIKIANNKNVIPAVITFNPDPNDVIFNTKNNHINSLKNRLTLFSKYGIKEAYVINFNKSLMEMEPDDFINKYLLKLNIKTIICGKDFTFGKYAKGTPKDLMKYFDVVIVDEVKFYGKKISSTRILKEINIGNIKKAERMLGHAFK